MDIIQEKFRLRFSAVDPSDRLTLASTLDLFQEIASDHAEDLGVGREAMSVTGQVWILSRISVQWDRRPKWRDSLTVRSWPRGSDKLFALRDYDIRDEEDRPLVRGRSGWIILDLEKRRPLRPQAIMENLPRNDGLDALPDGPVSLSFPGGGENGSVVQGVQGPKAVKAGERRAAYSDIDYNGHVNNTRYIEWIQDIVEPGVLEGAARMRLDVNYLSEVKPGGTVELWTASLPVGAGQPWPEPAAADAASAGIASGAFNPQRAYAFEGRRAEGGQAVFRAELRVQDDPVQ
ncbi:MAG: acyl-ACP thioesterase [Treponema sp.]|jgi:acyl-ACP thioesterase|nr:acyl-ACP thioesterase [Treponema sp.]